jgi:hypothetical protein
MTEDYCLLECETGTSSIDWSQLSRFYLKPEREPSLHNVVFLNKNCTTEIVQKHNVCINVPSSETSRY